MYISELWPKGSPPKGGRVSSLELLLSLLQADGA